MTAFQPTTCTGGLAQDGVDIRVAPSDGDLTNGGIRATHSIQLASILAECSGDPGRVRRTVLLQQGRVGRLPL
jgi:hypothetical protein